MEANDCYIFKIEQNKIKIADTGGDALITISGIYL